MVDYGCIALDRPVHGKVATVSSIGDFVILKHFNSSLDGLDSASTVPEECDCDLTSAVLVSSRGLLPKS